MCVIEWGGVIYTYMQKSDITRSNCKEYSKHEILLSICQVLMKNQLKMKKVRVSKVLVEGQAVDCR